MAGLPTGWEWDYDGSRWFYKYKPTGHVQYHFPSEGDEFPDFVDAAAPIPDLAPEERLESQQQVKRQTSTSRGSFRPGSGSSAGGGGGWKTRMSATARPVSNVWEGDGDDGVFRPESFMFLGPGAYTDVSPLADEEEEAARRTVAGGINSVVDRSSAKGVSPMGSEKTTPMVAKSEIEGSPVPALSPTEEKPEPVIHMLDSREMPHELPVEMPRRDPVGIVAEMATEHTAQARVETHPDPVEIGDNAVLAPIETAAPAGIAELPERSSPVEKPPPAQSEIVETRSTHPSIPELGHEKPVAASPPKLAEEQGEHGKYQPYAPGQATQEEGRSLSAEERRERHSSLQREASLLMGSCGRDTSDGDRSPVPSVLSPPQSPPKDHSDNTGSRPESKAISPPATVGEENKSKEPEQQAGDQGLSYFPSVLKPSLNGKNRNSTQGTPQSSPPVPDTELQGYQGGTTAPETQQGVTKFPSVLRPARGRAPSQPGQEPPAALNNSSTPDVSLAKNGFVPPAHGQHPPSMTPAPIQQAQPPQELQRQDTAHNGTHHVVAAGQHGSSEGLHAHQNQQLPSPPAQPPYQIPQAANLQQPPYPLSVQEQTLSSPPLVQAQQTPYPPSPTPAPAAPYGGRQQPPMQHIVHKGAQGLPPSQSPPTQQVRRQSTFTPVSEVSPIHSRSGSQSSGLPNQTPSPLEPSRRASSSASLAQGYTPSPMSQTPASETSPPSAQSPPGPPVPGKVPLRESQGSYFPPGDAGPTAIPMHMRRPVGQGQDVPKRHSMPAQQIASMMQQSPMGQVSPGPAQQASPQGLQRAQSMHQIPSPTQGPARPPKASEQSPEPQVQVQVQQRLSATPSPGHVLGRIEEREEPEMPAPRVTHSLEHARKSSVASGVQPETRRQAVQLSDPGQGTPQGLPQGHTGSRQMSAQPNQGQSPSIQPIVGHPPQSIMVQPGQMPAQAQMAPIQGPPGRMQSGLVPTQEQKPLAQPTGGQALQGMVVQPNQMPPQGQIPPNHGPPGQINLQGQMPMGQPPQGQMPTGQLPPGRVLSPGQVPPQGQMLPAQMAPQGQLQPSQGKILQSGQMPPGQVPLQGQVLPGQPLRPQMHPQMHTSQMPPPGHMPARVQTLPAQINPGQMPMQIPPGQMPPPWQNPPQGPMPPQGFIPPGQPHFTQQPPWNPQMQQSMSPASRPGSVPPQGTPAAGKEKKWTKWFKGSKPSTPLSPAPQPQFAPMAAGPMPGPPAGWNAEFSQPPGRQPGQPAAGQPQPGFPAQNMPPQFAQPPLMDPGFQTALPSQGPSPTPPTSSISDSASIRTMSSVETHTQPQTGRQSPQAQRKPQTQAPVQQPRLESSHGSHPQTGLPQNASVMAQGPAPASIPYPQSQGGHQRQSASVASLAAQHAPQQQQQPHNIYQQPPMQQQQPNPVVQQNMVPAPLFSRASVPPNNSGGPPPGSNQAKMNTAPGPTAATQPSRRDSKWTKNPAADYSGGDWGEEDDWHY